MVRPTLCGDGQENRKWGSASTVYTQLAFAADDPQAPNKMVQLVPELRGGSSVVAAMGDEYEALASSYVHFQLLVGKKSPNK